MTSKTNTIRKYVFTLRKESDFFGNTLTTDCFLETTDIEPESLAKTVNLIAIRLRFNPDSYPHMLMISGEDLDMTRETLETYINSMEVDEQKTFLEESQIL